MSTTSRSNFATAIALLLPLLFLAWRRRTELPTILALAASAALAAAIVQHKGWSYHILPVQMFACALGGVLAAQWFDARHATLPGANPGSVAAAQKAFLPETLTA